jgi:ferredoxin-NADP reductase
LNREAEKGLTVEAHGPFGQFYFDEARHRTIVLFAGGSGITPIMSMLRYIEEAAPNTEIMLFYAVHTEQDVIFEGDLQRFQKRLPRFRCLTIASKPTSQWQGPRGHLNRAMIEHHLGEVRHKTFFLCRPPTYMTDVADILLSLNVRAEQILQELFTINAPPAASLNSSTCTVAFSRSGRKYACSSADTLIIAERNGIDVPSSCRVGQCGTCATRVLDGDVEMEVEDGLDPALRAQGYRLLCVGRARGPLTPEA